MKRIFKLLFNSKSLGVLMLALMLPFSLNLAEAAKPCITDPKHQGCKDDGDEDFGYVTTAADNWAYWDGPDFIWEETPNLDFEARNCGNGGPADPNPQGYVAYICHEYDWPMDNIVHINLDSSWRSGTPEGPGDNGFTAVELCGLVEGGSYGNEGDLVMNLSTSESRSYYYGMDPTWNEGPCIGPADPDDPDTCLVLFATQAYFDHPIDHPDHCSDRKCGRRVQLAGWGKAIPAGKIPDTDIYEYNPFVNLQNIPIDRLTVTFRAIGKNKVAASCHYDVTDEEIYFRTRISE